MSVLCVFCSLTHASENVNKARLLVSAYQRRVSVGHIRTTRVRATRLNEPVGRRLSRVSSRRLKIFSRRLTAAFSRGITLVRGRSHD